MNDIRFSGLEYTRRRNNRWITKGIMAAMIMVTFYLLVSFLNKTTTGKSVGNNMSVTSRNPPSPQVPLDYLSKGEEIFYEAATSLSPVTDKVTTHSYQFMYGKFLLPYYYQNPSMKMLEIGLGCDMVYGPGASTALWKQLFPLAEMWEAEFDAACVEKHRTGALKDFNVLVGDQGDPLVLDSWIANSGGSFDVVIDDGGHQNCQIWTSFLKLWPMVKAGGLYFIEDMQVAKWREYNEYSSSLCDKGLNVPDKLKEFVDDLIYDIRVLKYNLCTVSEKRV